MARFNSTPRTLLLILGVVALQALLVAWFTWPTANATPHGLPVVVAGPAQAADQVAALMNAQNPGAFTVTAVADEAAADQALRDRQAYAAIIPSQGQGAPAVHIASAASPSVAQAITTEAQRFGNGAAVAVTDVVPTDARDPRGVAFLLGLLPFVLTSLIAGAVLALLVRGRLARLLSLVVYAVLTGLAGAAVLRYWLDVMPGGYLANAGVLGLFALAVAAIVGGLGALLGGPGIGLGVLLTFVFANPISGLTAAPELLPWHWGQIGQYLPVGAAGSLLRSVAYFDGAAGATPALALGAWAVVGAVLLVLARQRPGLATAGRPAVPEPVPVA